MVYTESEVKELWAENQTIQNKEQETEIEMLIEDWQVDKEMLYYAKSVDHYEDYQQEHTKNKSQQSPRL
ncbi:hypothetical protein [Lactobacillus helveticus]|uniref:hypothetical protein n=1 Tax=Lactobacillus helveticus TaxID=1587 RepID=UPI00218208ED|nr:hypothetical protein [Lactobacillus helveticus]